MGIVFRSATVIANLRDDSIDNHSPFHIDQPGQVK
jgi:hypothetical protein